MIFSVAAAAAHRMRSVVRFPHTNSSPQSSYPIRWNFDHAVVLYLSVTQKLLKNPPRTDALLYIQKSVLDIFRSVRRLFTTMDWDDFDRNLATAGYKSILAAIEEIHNGEQSRNLVTLHLVDTLASAFARLIREEDWEHARCHNQNVNACRDILVRMRSRLTLTNGPIGCSRSHKGSGKFSYTGDPFWYVYDRVPHYTLAH